MPICAKAYQNADGQLYLVLDPSAPDLSACPYVVESGAELANSLFSLTAEDGAGLAGSIVGVWAAAWCIRAVINVVRNSGGTTT